MKYILTFLAVALMSGCIKPDSDHDEKSVYFKKQLLACKMAGYPRFTAHDVEVFCIKTENGSDVMTPAKELIAQDNK